MRIGSVEKILLDTIPSFRTDTILIFEPISIVFVWMWFDMW